MRVYFDLDRALQEQSKIDAEVYQGGITVKKTTVIARILIIFLVFVLLASLILPSFAAEENTTTIGAFTGNEPSQNTGTLDELAKLELKNLDLLPLNADAARLL